MLGFAGAYVYIPKSYPIYQEALELARKDQKVKLVLGDNINDALFGYSKISRGLARFEIPISGNKGAGELLVYGSKKEDVWVLDNVYFKAETLTKRYVLYGK